VSEEAARTVQDWQAARLHAQKMGALGELASGITHDFRNILQTVISTLELMEIRAGDAEEVRRLAASAMRASERGIGLTQRLLRFARFEAVHVRATCLLASLESAAETLERTVEARIKVGVETPDADLWLAVIDPTELELALINLGINARDAMSRGGRICIGARNVTIPVVDRRAELAREQDEGDRRGGILPLPGGDYVAVTVGDTGCGMDHATLVRAVEPFFTTKAVGQGTGLGLAAVQRLAVEVQGALRLKSEPGRGTTVELWLPRASEVVSETAC